MVGLVLPYGISPKYKCVGMNNPPSADVIYEGGEGAENRHIQAVFEISIQIVYINTVLLTENLVSLPESVVYLPLNLCFLSPPKAVN